MSALQSWTDSIAASSSAVYDMLSSTFITAFSFGIRGVHADDIDRGALFTNIVGKISTEIFGDIVLRRVAVVSGLLVIGIRFGIGRCELDISMGMVLLSILST